MKLENLSALFENGAYTLVLQKDGETIYKDFGRGVGPALRVYDTQPELLRGLLAIRPKQHGQHRCDACRQKQVRQRQRLQSRQQTVSGTAAEKLTYFPGFFACSLLL